MRNLAFSLFEKEKIETTEAKAKEVRGFVDQLVTLAKEGSLHSQRRARALLGNKIIGARDKKIDIVGKLFKELAERLKEHKGGYTRITKIGFRPGDAAPKVVLELVKVKIAPKKEKKTDKSSDEAKTADAKSAA